MDAENRREARRYVLAVPARVGEHEGNVRDMSSRGLYFTAPQKMEVGFAMEIELELPSSSMSAAPLKVRLQTRVTRAEDLGDRLGVAARIESWEIPQGDRSGLAGLLKLA